MTPNQDVTPKEETPKEEEDKDKKDKGKKKYTGPPRNEDIKHEIVQVTESSRLSEPIKLTDVLLMIKPKKTFVELVSEVGPYPIVKFMSYKAEFDRQKLHKRKARNGAVNSRHKEIQMTWGSTSNDLAHKLERVRDELEKGMKVVLVFAPRKGQILPGPSERHAQTQDIVDMVADIGKEWKPRDEGKITAVFLQGNAPTTLVRTISKVPKSITRKEERRVKESQKIGKKLNRTSLDTAQLY